MRMSRWAVLVGLFLLTVAPVGAQAAQTLSLSFTGVTGGIATSVTPNLTFPATSTATFTGPVTIDLSIADYLADPYVSSFSIHWGLAASAPPYTTGWSATGSPSSVDPFLAKTFLSTVSLSDTGGSIHIFPSAGYVGFFDGGFNLDLDYTFPIPQPLTSSYSTDLVGGNGSVGYSLNQAFDPSVGFYDGSGSGRFQINGVTAVANLGVPEPAMWALMIVGFFGLGAALRAQRRRTRLAA
jgi:hypothetical protein